MAEGVNRILLDGARTLMHAANLPKELWLEAVQTIGYLRNHCLPTLLFTACASALEANSVNSFVLGEFGVCSLGVATFVS